MPRNESPLMGLFLCARRIGLPDRDRTCDPQLRRLLLYPTELRAVKTQKALEWAFVVCNEQRPGHALKNGRSGGIRTRDPLLPKQMRYQAALRSDCTYSNLQTQAFHDPHRKNLSPLATAFQPCREGLSASTAARDGHAHVPGKRQLLGQFQLGQ